MHLTNHIHHPDLVNDSTLHVIGVVSNHIRFHSRYRLFRKWMDEMIATPHVKLHIVELAYGDRHFEIEAPVSVNLLQLRTDQELWHKENMINLAVRHLLPRNWRYVCWCDADISFDFKGWALESIHQLQHHPIIQPWQNCVDLGPNGHICHTFESFCYVDRLGVKKQCHPSQPYKYAHSGFAWACTREFWENVHGLMEFPILGSADHHMAWACINGVMNSIHHKMTKSFHRRCLDWQRDAYRVTQGNLGFVGGFIKHYWHGQKKNRKYRERWEILVDAQYDPDTDLGYDKQGLIYIIGKPKLKQEIRNYFRFRSEDSIDEY
jgi:hypothetical protein